MPFGLRLDVLLALLAVWLIWGSTYLAIKIAIVDIPPFMLIAARFLVAGGVLFIFARSRGEALPTPAEWRNAGIVGLLMLGGGVGLTANAEVYNSSSLTTILIAFGSVLNVLAAGLLTRVWPRGRDWLGIALGVSGVFLLSFDGDVRNQPWAVALQFVAMACWALGSAISQRLPIAKGMMGSASEMMLGGVALTLFSILRQEPIPAQVSLAAAASWAFLVVFGSIVAYTAYMHLLKHVRPGLATSYSYVNPLVAIVLGFAVLGERVGPMALLAVAVIVSGVVILSIGRARQQA
jgi:drug/metabolite transporter (DMT)-like permease